jgi:threonine dehydratase
VVVPIGGGGLISGIGMAVKTLKPSCRVVGVQAAGAASMYTSQRQGRCVELSTVATIADGIAVKKPGALTFELCSRYVDEIVTVNEDEIASAMLQLIEGQKTVAEGAGATPVAAVMFGRVDTTHRKTVCVVSGGNVDVTTLSRVITKGLSKSGRIVEISTKITDKPGNLMHLLQVIADTGANIVSINHAREDRHSDVGACIVNMVLETRNQDHIRQIETELATRGYHLIQD